MIKKLILSLFIIAIGGLVYFTWFDFNHQFILIGWDTIIPLNPEVNLKYLTTWVDNNNGTIILSSLHFMNIFYWLLSKLTNSLTMQQAIHVYFLHVVGALGVLYLSLVLLRTYRQKIALSLLASIFYLFSPSYLNMQFAYPPVGFVPLALGLYIDGFHRKNKFIFALLIGIIVGMGNLPDPHPRPFFLITVPMIVYSILELLFTKKVKEISSYFALVFIYIFLTNAWFFFGLLANLTIAKNLFSFSVDIPITFGVQNKFADEGVATIDKMFRLFHDGLPMSGAAAKTYLSNFYMLLAHYLKPVLAFLALLFMKRYSFRIRKSILFLVTLTLLFLFFAKSVNPPLGTLYKFALENIPIFRMFRTAAYFILPAVIAYSILMSFSIFEIIYFLKKRNFARKFYAFLGGFILIAFVLIGSYPIFLKFPAYLQPDPAKPATLGMRVPKDYYKLGEYIDKQKNDAKTMTLPLDPGYEILKENPWYFGIPMLPFIMNKPIVNQRIQDFGGSFSLPVIIEKALLEGNPSSKFLLDASNIRYLVVKNNATNIDKNKANENINKYYPKIKTFGNYILYENSTHLQHFYVPKNVLIEDNDPEKIQEVINKNKISSSTAIYFMKQNDSKKIMLLNKLKKNPVKPPTINYQKISQTKYKVTVKNASSAFPLVFSETFNNGWVIDKNYVNSSHEVVNGFFNSWIISPNVPNFEFQVFYLPQKFMDFGYFVSLVTIALSLLGYIFVKINRL